MKEMIKFPNVHVQLIGSDGNAIAILAKTVKMMRRAGVSPEEIDEFRKEALSGDYDNLLYTVQKWVNVS